MSGTNPLRSSDWTVLSEAVTAGDLGNRWGAIAKRSWSISTLWFPALALQNGQLPAHCGMTM